MDNRIIIFGSGNIGYAALEFLGKENILCFCDNNPQLAGTEKYGKSVISFDELKQKHSDSIIVIAVGAYDSYSIARQCDENDVFDYIFYKFLKEQYPEWQKEQVLDFIINPINRMRHRQDIQYERLDKLQKQVNYFMSHADIRYMKPANGKLRKRQLECVHAAAEFLEKIKELEIKPFLFAGNLIGYLRHNGFIPWDDDIDFMLIRDEYEKLKEWCRLHMYDADEFTERKSLKKDIAEGLEDYYWGCRYKYFYVVKNFPDGHYLYLEFFSLDYYADDFDFTALKQYVGEVKEGLRIIDPMGESNPTTTDFIEKEKLKYIEKILIENKNKTVRESNNVFWGIDSLLISVLRYPREQFIPREVIFPLKKILFEGEHFWIPNDAEEFLSYEYFGNIWEFPQDVGLQHHSIVEEEDE